MKSNIGPIEEKSNDITYFVSKRLKLIEKDRERWPMHYGFQAKLNTGNFDFNVCANYFDPLNLLGVHDTNVKR